MKTRFQAFNERIREEQMKTHIKFRNIDGDCRVWPTAEIVMAEISKDNLGLDTSRTFKVLPKLLSSIDDSQWCEEISLEEYHRFCDVLGVPRT